MSTHLTPSGAFPMAKLFHKINDCLLPEYEGKFNVFDLMAIIYTETLGESFDGCMGCGLKVRIGEAAEVTGIPASALMARVRLGKGLNSGKYPKFIFDPGAYHFLLGSKESEGVLKTDLFLLCCGWGLARRYWTVNALSESPRVVLQYIDEFRRDELMQVRQLAKDLSDHGFNADRANVEKFERYTMDDLKFKRKHSKNFADRMVSLSEYFESASQHHGQWQQLAESARLVHGLKHS